MRARASLRRGAAAATAAMLAPALVSLPSATLVGLPAATVAALVGLGATATAAAPASAQVRPPRAEAVPREPASGWIGISFDVVTTGYAGGASRTTVVVANTGPGSPADEAGIRPGDVLLAINELRGAQDLAELPERLRIHEGDEVRLVIERDGQRREIRVRAAAMPEHRVAARSFTLSVEPDSVVASLVRAMDSLRSRLTAQAGSRTVLRQRGWSPAAPAPGVLTPTGDAWMRGVPFHLFAPDEHDDSLRREAARLDVVLTELRARERVLERALAGAASGSGGDAQELERVRAAIDEVSRRSEGARQTMAEAAGVDGASGFMFRYDEEPRGAEPHATAFRPLTPYLLGRNRVAGAEVVDLRPELAAYFGVGGGVLIVDVPEGTPAALSGLRPGDVVTHIGGAAVSTVEALRAGVARAHGPLTLTLVRQGEARQVVLGR